MWGIREILKGKERKAALPAPVLVGFGQVGIAVLQKWVVFLSDLAHLSPLHPVLRIVSKEFRSELLFSWFQRTRSGYVHRRKLDSSPYSSFLFLTLAICALFILINLTRSLSISLAFLKHMQARAHTHTYGSVDSSCCTFVFLFCKFLLFITYFNFLWDLFWLL